MPSRVSIAYRKRDAETGLNQALAEISGRLGIAIPPVSLAGLAARDADFRLVLMLEQVRQATDLILQAIAAPAAAAGPAEAPAPAGRRASGSRASGPANAAGAIPAEGR